MAEEKIIFPEKEILAVMESLRRPNGVFIASPTPDYSAIWIRDQLYCSLAYLHLGDNEKLKQGIWVVFDIIKKYEQKVKTWVASPFNVSDNVIHAKYNPDTLEEITSDDGWGHNQLDALGLFLYSVAELDAKNIPVIRDEKDSEIIQLLVYYLRSMEYWHLRDFGMWEECKIRHSSSIGAVIAGLNGVKNQKLAVVPESLIKSGKDSLKTILPFESKDHCHNPRHCHNCDMAQLSLIWPYNVIDKKEADEILERITKGYAAENGEKRKLSQTRGFNRFWGDDYYRSTEGEYKGISAEWVMFEFWLSLIYSRRKEPEQAADWFEKASKKIIGDKIPEAYCNGKPNDHTPLAWAHAIALIAFKSLLPEKQKEFNPCQQGLFFSARLTQKLFYLNLRISAF